MSDVIAELEPKILFRHFAALTTIPRGSRNEGKAREYVRAYARERNYDTRIDQVGNIVVRVPPTRGHEAAPTVILQGHLDMVCEKAAEVNIDFAHDPIPAFVDGDVIRSRGTTLGADNGIGVAAALAVAEDPECVHPRLELLFTVDEETGMTGAFNLTANMIEGRVMLNLDSEDEGTLFVGCAGGGDCAIRIPVKRVEVPTDYRAVTLRVSGLCGGHSGLDIARGRGNAIRIAARAVLAGLDGRVDDALLCSITGGNKKNAIPREATVCLWLPKEKVETFEQKVADFTATVRMELSTSDPDVTVTTSIEQSSDMPIDAPTSGRILRLLLALPHGPLAMSQDINGLVETSSNLAVVSSSNDTVTVLTNSRSSVASAISATRLGIKSVGELAGGSVELSGEYPGWRPNMSSRLLAVCREVWKRTTGKDAIVTAVHAGLECGVIGERIPGMDMISFGPDIHGAHSPDENVSISSTRRFYDFLKALLRELA